MRKLTIPLLYLLTAIWVSSIWTYMARTETHQFPFANIEMMSHDGVSAPFIWRRLAIDTSKLIVRIVPQSAWARASDVIDRNELLNAMLRGSRMGWTRETDPILISMTSLIFLSALGFLITARWLIHTLYVVPPDLAHYIAIFLGLALLGGRGNASAVWNNYPYDIPQSFMFLMTTTLIFRGNLLFAPMYLLACYSKETSVMLAVVFALCWPKRGRGTWVTAAVMFVIFALIRRYITSHHQAEHMKMALVATTLRNLMGIFFYSIWTTPLFVLSGVMFHKHWHEIPWQLKRMLLLPLALFVACIFKGWIEERRAYLEAMPYVGLILIQVIFWEAGKRGWLVPRNPHGPEFPTVEGRFAGSFADTSSRGFPVAMQTRT